MITRLPRRLVVTVALAALTGAGLGAAPPAAAQTAAPVVTPRPVLYEDTPNAIDENFVVVLAKNTSPSDTPRIVSELVNKYGGTIRFTYTSALQGFAVEISADKAHLIAGEPSVDYVAQDQTVTLDALGLQNNPPSWGLDRIDQRSLPLDTKYFFANTASTARAFIIDSGILLTHQEFGGRAICGFDPFLSGCAPCNQFHGTHVAGTVGGATVGVAKAIQLISVKVFNCAPSTPTSVVIAGVDFVTLAQTLNPNPRSVANMSLGGSAFQPLDDAVNNSINANVHYSVAAGNGFGANACGLSPARVPNATTVGSTDINDARSGFSNIGVCIDFFGPGGGILSAVHTANNAYGVASGTSMATPHATGTAAMWRTKFPADNAVAVGVALAANATPGVVINPGAGSPNLLLFSGMIPV